MIIILLQTVNFNRPITLKNRLPKYILLWDYCDQIINWNNISITSIRISLGYSGAVTDYIKFNVPNKQAYSSKSLSYSMIKFINCITYYINKVFISMSSFEPFFIYVYDLLKYKL